MFAPAFTPLANPEAIVNGKLALTFLEEGWEVDIISRRLVGATEYDYGSTWREPWLPLRDHTHEVTYVTHNKVKRLCETVWAGLKMGHPIEGCRWAMYAYKMALHLHRHRNYNVILSRALPDAAHLPAMALARKTGLPWIANWNDASGVKNLPPFGEGPKANLGRFNEGFIKEIAQNANWLTFPSDRMKRYICQYLGTGTEKKSSTVPHAALTTGSKYKNSTGKKFTLCYAGNISPDRNLSIFLEGLERFIRTVDGKGSVEFAFIGFDRSGHLTSAQASNLGNNIRLLGTMTYTDCQDFFSHSDVLLIIESPFVEGIYLPAKFVDYVQSGKPVLAVTPEPSTLGDYLNSFGGGLAVDCRSPMGIAEALTNMYEMWLSGTLGEKLGSSGLQKFFSSDMIIAQYKRIFESIGVDIG
jgi:glycosyltransferase involved in cell wall biosynthesis